MRSNIIFLDTGYIADRRIHRFMADCDGCILTSNICYEGEAISAIAQWLSRTSRPLFAFGPLSTPERESIKENSQTDEKESQAKLVLQFLDEAVAKRGNKSALYVRALVHTVSLTDRKLRFLLELFFGPRNPRSSGRGLMLSSSSKYLL